MLRTTLIKATDTDELAAALAAAGLPASDLNEPGRLFFRFDDGVRLVGFGGLEGHGADRLLRSLVVAPDRRGSGLGRVMLARLESDARALGVERLHLLTTTAAPFFRVNGYADMARISAPSAISGSREFTSLCPSSATYLVKAF